MNYSQFLQYINDKYVNADGTSNVDGVHHYEIAQSSGDTAKKIEVYNNSALYTGDTDFYASATTITNREYEESLQDERRKIRLLDPKFVEDFVEEYITLMNEAEFADRPHRGPCTGAVRAGFENYIATVSTYHHR